MDYRWVKGGKVGRKLGQIEGLDESSPATRRWLEWGWIEPVHQPLRPGPETAAPEAPPEHRAYLRGNRPARKLVEGTGV